MNLHTPDTLRAFERRIADLFAQGLLPSLVHLSGGNEAELVEFFKRVQPEDWVLSTHRNHYHALLKGIPEHVLEREILSGRSMFVYSAEHRFISSAILAGLVSIACGIAAEEKRRATLNYGAAEVFCFVGDGAEDNGHFAEAVRFAASARLRVSFIIEDNDRQVDTSYLERWRDTERTKWPWNVYRYHYKPTWPHAGAGLPPGSVKFQSAAVEGMRDWWVNTKVRNAPPSGQ